MEAFDMFDWIYVGLGLIVLGVIFWFLSRPRERR